MRAIWERLRRYIKSLAETFEKWRWLILAFIGLSLLWVEIQEFFVLRVLDQPFHYFEVFQYAVLLISTGLLIELFARSNHAHKRAVRILEFKHKLSLELTSNDDWETLLHMITEFPGTVTAAGETYLLVADPATGRFEKHSHWVASDRAQATSVWDPLHSCPVCLENMPNERSTFHLCRNPEDNIFSPFVYSLGLRSETFPTTVLKFMLKPGYKLLRDEEWIFQNIGDEIVAILQTSQDRKRLSEMQSAQVAMAERRMVSSFVHDQLGQNLGYMHLKLDQLSAGNRVAKSSGLRSELERLREVANESYEIVRDILKKIQPETIPHLANLLHEHAKTVTRRAGITLEFKATGRPAHLPASTQQLIFFAYREVFSNVEKHAKANKVTVLVTWSEDFLDISVADNGQGFDLGGANPNEHFGLEIMKERITSIKGKLSVDSSAGSGTVISISIPLESGKRAPA